MFSISRVSLARVSAFTSQEVARGSVIRQALRLASRFLKASALVFLVLLTTRSAVSVASPLTTDDTEMLGKDKKQFELSTEYSTFAPRRERVWTPELSLGVSDSAYIMMNMPYQYLKPDFPEESARGVNDPSFGLKWRFYESNGLSFAFAPSVTIPLGDEEDGLGNGRATYRAIGLMQYEAGAFTWLVNAGYIRNNNVAGDRRNLWSASAGVYYQLNPETKLGVDYGYNSDGDPNISRLEHFAGVGATYSPNDRFDFSVGYKHGFNEDSLDHSWLASVVYHW